MQRCGAWGLGLGVAIVVVGCGSDEASSSGGAGGAGGVLDSGTGDAGGGQTGGSAGAQTGGSGGSTGGTGGGTGGGPTGGAGGGTAGSAGVGGGTAGTGGLPEGNSGIAAKYPGDVGIEADTAVLFADGFEDYAQASDLYARWDAVYQEPDIRIATESENVYGGAKALEFTVPQQSDELSNATDKVVSPERDALFLRYYSKFQPPYDVVGSSHNGSMISAHYFENGQATPGVPANGTNKFLANLENWRGEEATPSPGLLNIYVYHPEQRSQWGDHFFPSGGVTPYSPDPFDFGPDFVSRPDVVPDLDRWYCYEYMVKANTPGLRDGRIAFWLDGVLAADFQNLRLRDIDSLKIDRFGLSFHIKSNTNGVSRKWYDNVVAASEYVGPMVGP